MSASCRESPIRSCFSRNRFRVDPWRVARKRMSYIEGSASGGGQPTFSTGKLSSVISVAVVATQQLATQQLRHKTSIKTVSMKVELQYMIVAFPGEKSHRWTWSRNTQCTNEVTRMRRGIRCTCIGVNQRSIGRFRNIRKRASRKPGVEIAE